MTSIRALRPGDSDEVRRIVAPEIDRSRYPGAARAALDAALVGATDESRACVAIREGTLMGVIVHGTLAGADGAGRLQLLVTAARARRTGVGRALVQAAFDDLRALGARFVFVEMPDDESLVPARRLLEQSGFRAESRVRDFFRDGVDLVIHHLDLGRR